MQQIINRQKKDEKNPETFLTQHAAAAFLQPFMPRKNARSWLISDARNMPLIRFFRINGETLYRWVDLQRFAVRVLNIKAESIPPSFPGIIERRGGERRSNNGQRSNKTIKLGPGIERRRLAVMDRRLDSSLDRRKHY